MGTIMTIIKRKAKMLAVMPATARRMPSARLMFRTKSVSKKWSHYTYTQEWGMM